MANQEDVFKKLVSHCKEYGFVFPSSEIYDGLGAVYDYGQNGVELKNNIKRYWWEAMTKLHENIVGIDAAIFMHPTVWKASGRLKIRSTRRSRRLASVSARLSTRLSSALPMAACWSIRPSGMHCISVTATL